MIKLSDFSTLLVLLGHMCPTGNFRKSLRDKYAFYVYSSYSSDISEQYWQLPPIDGSRGLF